MEIEKHIHIKVGEISLRLKSWDEAKKYAEAQGMRLPTRIEALSMIDAGMKFPGPFWTRDDDGSRLFAWFVYADGSIICSSKHGGYYSVPVSDFD